MRQVKSEEARRTFRELLDEAERGGAIGVLRYERPVAVLVSAEWYETVIAYIGATTFTSEAADFYARQREAGNRVLDDHHGEGSKS